MKRYFLGCAMLALAACSPASEPASETPAEPAAAAKRLPLPDCASVQAEDKGAEGWKHPDCRLMIPGDAGLAFEARYTSAEDESTLVTLQIVQPGDATIQTLAETMGNTFEPPSTQDVDLDGLADILVPLETGNVNTTWAVWRQTKPADADVAPAPDQTFVRAGELSGVEIKNTSDGLIAVAARSSASSWSVEFVKMDGATFKTVAMVDVVAQATDDGTITGVACALSAEAELDPGLDAKTAEAKFCAEPAAADIFK
jgi:hypothetical protein